MPIWYTFYTFICLREQIFKNSIAREASFQEALALAERREVEKKGSILPLPHQAYTWQMQPTEIPLPPCRALHFIGSGSEIIF